MERPQYDGTHIILAIMAFLFVIGALVGTATLLYGFNLLYRGGLFSIPLIYAGFAALVTSLVLLVIVQVGRAILDNTLINWEILSIKQKEFRQRFRADSMLDEAAENELTSEGNSLTLTDRDGKPRFGARFS
jgi:hypothetical protein